MSAFHRQKGRLLPIRPGLVITGLTGCAVVTFAFLHTPHPLSRPQSAYNAPAPLRLTPAAWQTPLAPKPQPQPAFAARIDVDATASQPTDPAALRSMLANAAGGNTANAGPKDNFQAGNTPWFAWGHLDAGRVAAHVKASADAAEGTPSVYAARSENGVTVCLVNPTNARLLTTTATRLPRGVYCIERLTVMQEKGKGRESSSPPSDVSQSNTAFSSPASSSPASSLERLERLEGCDLGGTGVVTKPLCLEPHQMCLYRYTDVAHTARASWQEVYGQLALMARDHSGPARRLGTMLHEADGYVSGVRGETRHSSLQSRLDCVHHLLLVTAQAHSLHHNYQMRHTVDEAEGRAVMAALDRLTDALSETSAALLSLVPQIDVTSFLAPSSTQDKTGANPNHAVVRPASFPLSGLAGKANTKEETAHGTPNLGANSVSVGAAANERAVTVTLANTGARTVGNVKLGLNMNLLPSGVACEPSDPAFFGALPPGQTIRAMFHLRARPGQTLPDMPLVGDVSYFAGTAPAHLRPRAW